MIGNKLLSACIVFACLAGCSTSPSAGPAGHVVSAEPIPRPEGILGSSAEQLAAVKERGAKTAAADIQAGTFRILLYGSKPEIDPETGYPTHFVMCCDFTGEVSAELEAYNQVMRDWHANHPKAGNK